jgi:hypothetical protein
MPRVFQSKKFQVAVVAFIVSLLITLVPQLEKFQDLLPELIAPFVAYILAQGLADFGKEDTKQLIEAENETDRTTDAP